MRSLLLLYLLLFVQLASAQVGTPTLNQDPAFGAVSHRIIYPVDAEQSGVYARIYAGFRIDQKGHLQDVRILNPIKVGHGLEEEIIKKLKRLPPIQPRYEGDYALPVTFALINYADSANAVHPTGYLSGSYLMGRTLLNELRITGDRLPYRKGKIIAVVKNQILVLE